MKIDIITYSFAHNYGAVLQTYGLYAFLKKEGYSVEVIDYIPKEYNIDSPNYSKLFLGYSSKWGKNIFTRILWKIVILNNMKRNRKPFRKFLNEKMHLSNKYFCFEELKENPPQADIYLTGSDQVWNSDYIWGETIDRSFYLDFLDAKAQRLSYASSFGKTFLSENEVEPIKSCLEKYKAISVRESAGQDILQEMGIDAEVVADPTILCCREEWNDLADKRIVTEPYILIFYVAATPHIIKMVKDYAQKKKMKVVIVSSNVTDKWRIRENVICVPEVTQWLAYIKYADFVVTNSFHGMMFSTIFEKQFAVIITNSTSKYCNRITNYLQIIGIPQHYAVEESINDDLFLFMDKNMIDYKMVNERREQFASQSAKWLLNALKN